MIDCGNAEMRDRLPDLLHGRLAPAEARVVEAHLELCAPCRAELALLERVRRAAPAAAVDIDAVARSVIDRTTTGVVAGRSARLPRRWRDWRIAAAVAAILVVGTSLAVLRTRGEPNASRRPPRVVEAPPVPILRQPSQPAAGAERVRVADRTTEPPHPTPAAELSTAGAADLSETELRALLGDIERLEALPITDPEPVTVRVSPVPGEGSER